MRKILGAKWDTILDTPQFDELIKGRLILHELSHSLYANEKDALEDIEEMKADVIAYAAFHDVFGAYAREHFGENANAAMNLAMLRDPLSVYASSDPKGEWRDYWVSSLTALNLAIEHGLIAQSKEKEGEAVLNDDALAEKNISKEIFSPHAEKILSVLKTATAKRLSTGIRQEIARLAAPQEHALVKNIREQINQKTI